MKTALGILVVLAGVLCASLSPPAASRPGEQGEQYADICVPEVGEICVCRRCIYLDDGTCSCPAEDDVDEQVERMADTGLSRHPEG